MTLSKTLVAALLSNTIIASAAFAETSIGGYGELHYNILSSDTEDKKEIDFHRFVLFIDHEFNEKIRFYSELELEHALSQDTADGSNGGAIELEQGYIEMDMSSTSTLKAGMILVPVGIINETHEPPTFYGVERNPVEKNIIPTTWSEGGAMFSDYTENGLSYDLSIHSGLSNKSGNIRSSRQKVAEATGVWKLLQHFNTKKTSHKALALLVTQKTAPY